MNLSGKVKLFRFYLTRVQDIYYHAKPPPSTVIQIRIQTGLPTDGLCGCRLYSAVLWLSVRQDRY